MAEPNLERLLDFNVLTFQELEIFFTQRISDIVSELRLVKRLMLS